MKCPAWFSLKKYRRNKNLGCSCHKGPAMRTVFSSICGQRRSRSACAFAQANQDLHCPLTALTDTTEYSRTSLFRTRLFRITAYLEMKIWSLFEHETMTTGNKIMWKRWEIAPKEQFLPFSTIFSVYLYFQESNYIFICEMWLFNLSFSSILQIWYVEMRISRSISESPLDFDITRVDCIWMESKGTSDYLHVRRICTFSFDAVHKRFQD